MLYCPSIKDCNLHSKHRQTLLTCLRLPPSHPGAVLPSIMEQEADKWAEINCFNYQASLLPSLLILFIRSTAALSRYHWDVWEPGTHAYFINNTCVCMRRACTCHVSQLLLDLGPVFTLTKQMMGKCDLVSENFHICVPPSDIALWPPFMVMTDMTRTSSACSCTTRRE